jgi:formate dehydrogenase
MATVLCVLYPDPVTGYPPSYARDDIPTIDEYPNGQSVPSPREPMAFKPGELLGCVSGEPGLRHYLEAHGHTLIVTSDKDGADCVSRSYDLEGMHFGAIAAGRIGLAVLRRLKPFDVHLHYHNRHRLSADVERELNLTYHASPQSLVKVCDVISLHSPLYPSTENMFDDHMLGLVKRGTYLINCARGKLCDRDAVVRALKTGKLAGYAGDVWFPQPAPADHPWRRMINQGMTPHMSGTSLSAQARYAAGTLEILQCFFDARPIRREYLIVDGGSLAGTGADSYRLN